MIIDDDLKPGRAQGTPGLRCLCSIEGIIGILIKKWAMLMINANYSKKQSYFSSTFLIDFFISFAISTSDVAAPLGL